MADIFGYNQEVKAGEIVASKDVIVQIDSGRTALVQSVQGSYSHRVEPQFEIGSSTMYLVNGMPQGNLNMTTLVGKSGWIEGLLSGKPACGDMSSLQFTISNTDCNLSVGKPILRFEHALAQSYSFTIMSGQLTVTQSVNFICGKLTKR